MIIAGYEFRGEKPFSNVYLTGIVRDGEGRKMSKSLGNSPEPLELIRDFSADGVRVGMLFTSPAGNDLKFPITFDKETNFPIAYPLMEQGRNFANKIWNSYRLVKGWEIDANAKPLIKNELAIRWFKAKLNNTLAETEKMYAEYRISDIIQSLQKLFWDDFCSWYLEMIKPSLTPDPSPKERGEKTPPPSEGAGGRLDRPTFDATIEFFDKLLRILHPFMPFITEEVWQDLTKAKAGDSICIAPYPKSESIDNQVVIEQMDLMLELIENVRNVRNQKQISPNQSLDLHIRSTEASLFKQFAPVFQIPKMANLTNIIYEGEKPKQAVQFLIKQHEFFVPIQVNVEEEKARLQKDLEYQIGFRDSTLKKLSNEKFVANAKPEIVATERQKLADAEAKIKSLEESLQSL
jgi:valyl-tRNA synthetase